MDQPHPGGGRQYTPTARQHQDPAPRTTYRLLQPGRAGNGCAAPDCTSGTNGNWAFHVTPTATTVRLAEPDQRRVVRFPYVSSQAGYGYVLYVGTDGKDMKQLFPEPGENNFLPAKGEFPALSIDPPAGNNTYLFVISQTPRDFDGIFKVGGTGSGIEDTTAVQCELTKRNSNRVKVGNPCDETRNSGRVRPEPVTGGMLEGYAAQMIVVSGK